MPATRLHIFEEEAMNEYISTAVNRTVGQENVYLLWTLWVGQCKSLSLLLKRGVRQQCKAL